MARLLPLRIGRFNYWNYFRPGGTDTTVLAKYYSKRQFNLLLTASPAVWNKEVAPFFHLKLSEISDRRFLALEFYVSEDAEWEGDGDARKIFNELSAQQQQRIRQLEKRKWSRRRKWDNLLRNIAEDQERFKEFCKNPPESGILTGTDHRIYVTYSRQATILLGGGRFIPKEKRRIYRDYYGDRSSLLTCSGRLPSQSIFGSKWEDFSPKDRPEAKTQTLHWFQHALRNMKEYRNNRPPVPWSSQCAAVCDRIQKKLCEQ